MADQEIDADDQIARLIGKAQGSQEEALIKAHIKHKLAIQAIAAIRTLMNVHRGFYEAMLSAEKSVVDASKGDPNAVAAVMRNRSFQIQCRMARALLTCLDELNDCANTALELAAKEKS